MAYVGNQPVPQATQTRDRFVATSGQTSFATSGYTPQFVDVYLDGVKLDSDEYTATNGSDIVLDTGATAGQILEVVAFSSFDVADIRNMTQPLGLKAYTTAERNALTNIGAGDTIFNSTTGSIEFYDGAAWLATNLIPTVNSVTGTIYAGAASTLTLNISNATDSVTVRFTEGGVTVADVGDISVSSGSASVAVPAAVYGQSAGDTIIVSVLNQDGTPSSNGITKTVTAIPSGGVVTESEGYRYHTFTSSGTFSNTLSSLSVEYLVVAGGGGGGGYNGAAGAGAGGYVAGNSLISLGTYSVIVGAGGSASSGTGSTSNSGTNSSLSSVATAIGGGYGATQGQSPDSGGSGGSGGGGAGAGGGGYVGSSGGSGTAGQGNNGGGGWYQSTADGGGGGGGAGQAGVNGAGNNGGSGGNGLTWLNGTTYAGGGAGGSYNGSPSLGGAGGGGNGGVRSAAGAGGTNTGGGGGGGIPGGSGGSGIVIVRYQLS